VAPSSLLLVEVSFATTDPGPGSAQGGSWPRHTLLPAGFFELPLENFLADLQVWPLTLLGAVVSAAFTLRSNPVCRCR